MKNKGFTLIELLVVISIISLLSSIVLASLNSARAKARDVRRLSDLHQIQNALELFYNQYGVYPSTPAPGGGTWPEMWQAFQSCLESGTGCFNGVNASSPYTSVMSKVPQDPLFPGVNTSPLTYKYVPWGGFGNIPACNNSYAIAVILETDSPVLLQMPSAPTGICSVASKSYCIVVGKCYNASYTGYTWPTGYTYP